MAGARPDKAATIWETGTLGLFRRDGASLGKAEDAEDAGPRHVPEQSKSNKGMRHGRIAAPSVAPVDMRCSADM